MRLITPVLLMLTVLTVGCSFKGAEFWRKSVCDSIVDSQERDRCLEEATRSENDYRQEKREAMN